MRFVFMFLFCSESHVVGDTLSLAHHIYSPCIPMHAHTIYHCIYHLAIPYLGISVFLLFDI
jgi:hypothetical protein